MLMFFLGVIAGLILAILAVEIILFCLKHPPEDYED
jgi:hypothetical protein